MSGTNGKKMQDLPDYVYATGGFIYRNVRVWRGEEPSETHIPFQSAKKMVTPTDEILKQIQPVQVPCVSSIRLMEPTDGSMVQSLALEENFGKNPKVRVRVAIERCEERSSQKRWRTELDSVDKKNFTIDSAAKGIQLTQYIDVEYGDHLLRVELLEADGTPTGIIDSVRFVVETPSWYQEIVAGPKIGSVHSVTIDGREHRQLGEYLQSKMQHQSMFDVVPLSFEDDLCELGIKGLPAKGKVEMVYKLRPFTRSLTEADQKDMFPALRNTFASSFQLSNCHIQAPSFVKLRIAVLISLSVLDEWKADLVPLLYNSGLQNAKIYVGISWNITDAQKTAVKKYIRSSMDNVAVVFHQSRGGHFGSFVQLVEYALDDGVSDYYLILHADHGSPFRLHARTSSIVGSEKVVKKVLHAFAMRSDVGMIVPKQGEKSKKGTSFTALTPGRGIKNACQNMKLLPQLFAPYPAGLMYWMRGAYLAGLFQAFPPRVWLTEMKSDDELKQAVDHAPATSERMIAYVMHSANLTLALV